MHMELSLSESMVEPGYSVGYAPAGKASVMHVSLNGMSAIKDSMH